MNSFEVEAAPQELNFPLCVSSGQVFRWRQVGESEWFGVDGGFCYQVKVGEGLLAVKGTGTQSDFQRLFSLDVNLEMLLQGFMTAAPELTPSAARVRGLRVMSQSDPVETTISFICTANNNLARIIPMVNALAGFGEEQKGPHTWHRFPSLAKLAEIDEADLRAKGFGYRGASVPKAARDILERGGCEWLESLKHTTYPRAHMALTGITGVGPKVADCICLFALGHHDAVPIDTHVWQAVVRLYRPEWQGGSLTAKRTLEVKQLFREKFGPYAGWAQQILFFDNLSQRRGKVKPSC